MTTPQATSWAITPIDAVRVLNQALGADPGAIMWLWRKRVRCNAALAAHRTIQVSGLTPRGPYLLSWLGLLNGIFGIDRRGGSPIVAITDDRSGHIVKFIVAMKIGPRVPRGRA